MGMGRAPGQRRWQRFEHPAPNSLWQMDFKGPVKTLGQLAHPLMMLDDHSRFNLCLRALANQRGITVQPVLVEIFRRYGLPTTLLVDNGSPWGDSAEQPYTALTAWLIRSIRVLSSPASAARSARVIRAATPPIKTATGSSIPSTAASSSPDSVSANNGQSLLGVRPTFQSVIDGE